MCVCGGGGRRGRGEYDITKVYAVVYTIMPTLAS